MTIKVKPLERAPSTLMTISEVQEKFSNHEKYLSLSPNEQLLNPHLRLHLSNVTLPPMVVTSMDLSNSTISHCTFTSFTEFYDCNLSNIDLSYSNISDTHFRSCNLTNANLEHTTAYLTSFEESNLTNASLDYSSLPLWCGTTHITANDSRLARQLAYHLCSINTTDPETLEIQSILAPYANKFHKVTEEAVNPLYEKNDEFE